MSHLSKIWGHALFLLAFSQSTGHAQTKTGSDGFAVSNRVASACEASGLCGTATIRMFGIPVSTGVIVTPLAPTADQKPGHRIDTGGSTGTVEIDF
jgi:hypothetical protein